MAVSGRLNRSTLSLQQRRQIKAALKSASTTKYVTADQALGVNTEVQAVVTDCQIPVEKNRVYRFVAFAYCTSADATAGAQISFTGSAAANFITGVYSTEGVTNNIPQNTLISAITTESDATLGLHTAVLVTATGTYSPSADGFFKLSVGPAAAVATHTGAIKKGSYLTLEEIA